MNEERCASAYLLYTLLATDADDKLKYHKVKYRIEFRIRTYQISGKIEKPQSCGTFNGETLLMAM
jgi:hypothetical protein